MFILKSSLVIKFITWTLITPCIHTYFFSLKKFEISNFYSFFPRWTVTFCLCRIWPSVPQDSTGQSGGRGLRPNRGSLDVDPALGIGSDVGIRGKKGLLEVVLPQRHQQEESHSRLPQGAFQSFGKALLQDSRRYHENIFSGISRFRCRVGW
jgi:hypothetical protein